MQEYFEPSDLSPSPWELSDQSTMEEIKYYRSGEGIRNAFDRSLIDYYEAKIQFTICQSVPPINRSSPPAKGAGTIAEVAAGVAIYRGGYLTVMAQTVISVCRLVSQIRGVGTNSKKLVPQFTAGSVGALGRCTLSITESEDPISTLYYS